MRGWLTTRRNPGRKRATTGTIFVFCFMRYPVVALDFANPSADLEPRWVRPMDDMEALKCEIEVLLGRTGTLTVPE